jgi:hypothetical protein
LVLAQVVKEIMVVLLVQIAQVVVAVHLLLVAMPQVPLLVVRGAQVLHLQYQARQ